MLQSRLLYSHIITFVYCVGFLGLLAPVHRPFLRQCWLYPGLPAASQILLHSSLSPAAFSLTCLAFRVVIPLPGSSQKASFENEQVWGSDLPYVEYRILTKSIVLLHNTSSCSLIVTTLAHLFYSRPVYV